MQNPRLQGALAMQIATYTAAYTRFGVSPRAVLWPTGELQKRRFRDLIPSELPLTGSVLDVGCGLADLKNYLEGLGWIGKYVGIDITPALLEAVWVTQPGYDVRRHDMSACRTQEEFEWSFISGLFNAYVPHASDFMASVLRNAYASTRVAMSFNFISSELGEDRPSMCYYEPRRVVQYCSTVLRPVHITVTKSDDGNVSVTVFRHRHKRPGEVVSSCGWL